MKTMPIIDSDTHVDENDQTWDHVGDESMRPRAGSFNDGAASRDFWVVDGYKVHKAKRDEHTNTKTTIGTRELLDIEARLRDMDELGVDIQVIYPTIFNRNPALRPEVELELTRSYNRWMGERTAEASGRLRWVCVLPLWDIEASIEELHSAKENGACGVLKKGDREADHLVWHDYFFPLYEEVERLDMPICFHQGTAKVVVAEPTAARDSDFIDQKAPAINGIASLLARDVPRQFPTLRFGCLEVAASWVVMVDHMHRRRMANRFERGEAEATPIGNIFAENRVWTTCEVDEDFATLLHFIDEDHLLVGSDYGHNDPSQDHWFVSKLEALVDEGVLSADAIQKMLSANPTHFYGL